MLECLRLLICNSRSYPRESAFFIEQSQNAFGRLKNSNNGMQNLVSICNMLVEQHSVFICIISPPFQ